MDFTELDRVIALLEVRKSLNPGSPPVMLNGHLGIWRTIRGFRMFLELQPGAGRYNFNGKTYKGGRVLVGPPSLTGQGIGDVGNDTWGKLSGTGTKESFTSASPEGLSSLKSSIRNSLKDDDTRIAALAETTDLQKLVQIARSAGFTDAEIKEALGGKVFQNAIGGDSKDEAPDNVVSLADHKSKKPKAEAPVEDEEPELPAASGDDVPAPKATKPAPKPTVENDPPQMAQAAGGEFGPVLAALKVPGIVDADKRQKVAVNLLDAADSIKNEFFSMQVRALAHGLQTGDYKLNEVRERVDSLIKHRKSALYAAISADAAEKLSDKAQAKEFMKSIKERTEKIASEKQEASPELDRITAVAEAQAQLIGELASRVQNPTVVKQLKVLQQDVRKRRIGGNSVVLRLLRILRLILAFIPG